MLPARLLIASDHSRPKRPGLFHRVAARPRSSGSDFSDAMKTTDADQFAFDVSGMSHDILRDHSLVVTMWSPK